MRGRNPSLRVAIVLFGLSLGCLALSLESAQARGLGIAWAILTVGAGGCLMAVYSLRPKGGPEWSERRYVLLATLSIVLMVGAHAVRVRTLPVKLYSVDSQVRAHAERAKLEAVPRSNRRGNGALRLSLLEPGSEGAWVWLVFVQTLCAFGLAACLGEIIALRRHKPSHPKGLGIYTSANRVYVPVTRLDLLPRVEQLLSSRGIEHRVSVADPEVFAHPEAQIDLLSDLRGVKLETLLQELEEKNEA